MTQEHPQGGAASASFIVVMTAVMASLLEIIDTSIVNVAIPHMQGNLGVTIQEITWVSTGYIISNAVVLPIAAWLAAKIGRKKYYTGCILIFTLTSVLCGIAPNFYFLVFARVLQGIAGGALLPTSQSIIQEQFPGEKSGIGSAIYGVSVMVGPAIGPTLGGYLTDHYDWRAIFFINLPIGLIATALSYFYIDNLHTHQAEEEKSERIDWMGFTLLIIGIGGLQYALERGQAEDWFSSMAILAAAVLAGLAIPIFYAWEYHQKHPIVDVRLFRESSVRGGSLLMALTGMILYAVIFLVPIYTDIALGMDATHTGYLYIPGSLATMATMPFVGRYLAKYGPKPFIAFGVLMVLISLHQLSSFTPQAGAGDIVRSFIVRGIGLGCIFVPINAMVLGQFKGEQLGQVAGLLNLSRQIGGSIGIAAMSTYLDRFSAQYRNDLRAHVTTASTTAFRHLHQAQGALDGALGSATGLDAGSLGGLKNLMGQMEQQVFQLSFNRLMFILLVAYAISYIPLFTLKMKQKVTGPVMME
jgi:DHA2 family multidrug resistance protein